MNVKEKVAYLSGLMDGLSFDPNSKEGKMFNAILGVLEEIGFSLEDLSEDLDDLQDFVEAMDEDLEDLEDEMSLFDDDDDDDDDYDDDDDDDMSDMIRIKCPACARINEFDPEILWEYDDGETEVEVLCTKCDAVIFTCIPDDDDDDDDDDDFDDEEDRLIFERLEVIAFEDDDDDDDDDEEDDD